DFAMKELQHARKAAASNRPGSARMLRLVEALGAVEAHPHAAIVAQLRTGFFAIARPAFLPRQPKPFRFSRQPVEQSRSPLARWLSREPTQRRRISRWKAAR